MYCYGLRWFKKFKENVNENIPSILNARIVLFLPPELQCMAKALTYTLHYNKQAATKYFF